MYAADMPKVNMQNISRIAHEPGMPENMLHVQTLPDKLQTYIDN